MEGCKDIGVWEGPCKPGMDAVSAEDILVQKPSKPQLPLVNWEGAIILGGHSTHPKL